MNGRKEEGREGGREREIGKRKRKVHVYVVRKVCVIGRKRTNEGMEENMWLEEKQ